jgi:hypothetical protein
VRTQVSREQEQQLKGLLEGQDEAKPCSLYHMVHMNLWTKLRPYVRVRAHHSGQFWPYQAALPSSEPAIHHLCAPGIAIFNTYARLLMISVSDTCMYLSCSWHAYPSWGWAAHGVWAPDIRGLPNKEFLEKAHELYEMHIYTHGNAEYAVEMARLLDPTRKFFAERIMSQVGNFTLLPLSNVLHLHVSPTWCDSHLVSLACTGKGG